MIVWDIINECGLYRLKGHKDIVTQALFLKDKNLLVTRCCTFEQTYFDSLRCEN